MDYATQVSETSKQTTQTTMNELQEHLHSIRDNIVEIEARINGFEPPTAMWFRSAAVTGLAAGRGWLGKALGATGTPTPYPQSDNAESKVIEPPAYNKPEVLPIGDTVAGIKAVRARVATVLELLDGLSDLGGNVRYIALAKTELERVRLMLGEELRIIGGY